MVQCLNLNFFQLMSIEDVEKIMEETQEGIEYQRVINYNKWTCSQLGFCIFVMFGTFQDDEMQYIFVEKNFIFMVFVVVKDSGTDVI